MSFVVSAPEAADDALTWDLGILIKNDPLCPIQTYKILSDGSGSTTATLMNQSFFSGTVYGDHTMDDFSSVLSAFQRSCEQYRLTALSATAHFTGAAMQAQGSVIAAQVSDPSSEWALANPSDNIAVNRPMRIFGQSWPSADSLVTGTSPYITSAKEGIYMPMKMEHPDRWRSTDQEYYIYRIDRQLDARDSSTPYRLETITGTGYPYPIGNSTSTSALGRWLMPVDDNYGVIWFKGLALSSSFRFSVHVCLEMMTRPASSFAPFTELPAPPDDHALAMYYEIASRMSDCYPARDNSTNQLWEKVKKIAGTVWDIASPILAATPLAPVAMLGDGVRATYNLVDEIVTGAKKKKARKVEAQKLQSAVDRAGAIMRSTAAQRAANRQAAKSLAQASKGRGRSKSLSH